MSSLRNRIEIQAERLTLYAQRAKDKLATGERSNLIDGMADVAEVGEITRRLYIALEQLIKMRG
jgi:hypothetical protein